MARAQRCYDQISAQVRLGRWSFRAQLIGQVGCSASRTLHPPIYMYSSIDQSIKNSERDATFIIVAPALILRFNHEYETWRLGLGFSLLRIRLFDCSSNLCCNWYTSFYHPHRELFVISDRNWWTLEFVQFTHTSHNISSFGIRLIGFRYL